MYRSMQANSSRLLGQSGSGKSTLYASWPDYYAFIWRGAFQGEPQHGANPHIAIVFQSFALFPWLTVLQNVELGLEAQPMAPTQRLKRALAAIDVIGLDGFEDAYPKNIPVECASVWVSHVRWWSNPKFCLWINRSVRSMC